MSKYQFFKEEEFANCSPKCKLSDMDQSLMNKLDTARSLAGVPFIINSAFRTREYEIQHGRSGASFHTKGMAVDIKCKSSTMRFRIVGALIASGFTGIGINKNFIHADIRENKPLIFLYDK